MSTVDEYLKSKARKGPTVIAKCTPSLGMVSIWWTRLTESIYWPMMLGKALFYVRDGEGNEVAECRNCLVNQVLTYGEQNGSNMSHILWIDDDVLVQPGCLLQLLQHDRDIVSGVYFSKRPGQLSEPLVFPGSLHGTAFVPNEVMEVWGHGMGLTLIKTDVYRRMRDELNLGLDKYGMPQWYHTGMSDAIESSPGILDEGHTEDLFFLDNAHKLGYKPLCDMNKHAFGFHYDAEKDQGYPEEQYNQWVRGEAIRWRPPGGEIVWD